MGFGKDKKSMLYESANCSVSTIKDPFATIEFKPTSASRRWHRKTSSSNSASLETESQLFRASLTRLQCCRRLLRYRKRKIPHVDLESRIHYARQSNFNLLAGKQFVEVCVICVCEENLD